MNGNACKIEALENKIQRIKCGIHADYRRLGLRLFSGTFLIIKI